MKPVPYHLLEHHIIRTDSTISVDTIEIIPYPHCLLVSWNIISSTQKLLSEILKEDFKDLLLRVILYRNDQPREMAEFYMKDSSGTLQISGLTRGSYYCELVASNSHNETVTIKSSSKIEIKKDDGCKSEFKWKEVTVGVRNETWLQTFSGYTVYE